MTESGLVRDPLAFTKNEFENNNSITPSQLENACIGLCKDPNLLMQMQSLNKSSISDLIPNRLVHFRCMVQDMYDPEFFYSAYDVCDKTSGSRKLRCGLYQDVIRLVDDEEEFDFESPNNKPMDRQILYCIPIPGESVWSKQVHNLKFADNLEKMQTECDNLQKRKNFDEAEESSDAVNIDDETITDDGGSSSINANEGHAQKKIKVKEDGQKSHPTELYRENFPLPDEKGFPAIVKVYVKNNGIKLNDTIEVFGILSLDPVISPCENNGPDDDPMDGSMIEWKAHHPNPLQVPRIHAVVLNRLFSDHPYFLSPFLNGPDSMPKCREQILTVFQHCFYGDELLAEYFLCHLLSSVTVRKDVTLLGKFSLNITHIPSGLIRELYQILLLLLNKCHFLPLTLENLNNLDFIPQKDYKLNRLKSGILQLSERTHLIVDETALQPGMLKEKGVLNMAALSNIVERQELNYNFQFYNQAYQTNIRVLVFSEGKSILKCDYHVPMVPSESRQNWCHEGARTLLNSSVLENLRAYLCRAENVQFNIPPAVQATIENDFVEVRRGNPEAMSLDDLSSTINLARQIALTFGSNELNEAHWRRAKEMEKMRKERKK